MIGRNGLITDSSENLTPAQTKLIQQNSHIAAWQIQDGQANLDEVVINAKPTVLIGVSGQPGLFTRELIEQMQSQCEQPIIFPLSNPSKKIEATPEQLIEWTKGKAIVATGSPFEPVEFDGKSYPIAQCNNSYIFPGLGLAVVSANIRRISEEMLMKASEVLAAESPRLNGQGTQLLPPLVEIMTISKRIAFAVAKLAQEQGLAEQFDEAELHNKIDTNYWLPEYREYVKTI